MHWFDSALNSEQGGRYASFHQLMAAHHVSEGLDGHWEVGDCRCEGCIIDVIWAASKQLLQPLLPPVQLLH